MYKKVVVVKIRKDTNKGPAMTLSLRRMLFSSLALWFLITITGIYFLVHLKNHINFGIDLVGGTYITLEVQVNKAIENELAERMQEAMGKLKKDQKPLPIAQKIDKESAVMTFASESEAQEVEQYLSTREAHLKIVRDGSVVQLVLTAEEIKNIERDAVQSNIGVLRTRLDQFGVGEITIAAQGDRNIIVELPNVDNPQQAKAMIGRAALLEIKLVEDSGPTEQDILNKYDGQLPEGMMIVPGKERRRQEFYVVPCYTDLTGKLLKDARMDIGGRSGAEPVVKFVFKPQGGDKFYDLTSSNLGRRVAILVDGVVITAPVVQSAIGAEGEITGDFTSEDAQELASLLKSGAFVAPVAFEEERQIGPSLGAESVRQGFMACAIGLGLLFIFSIVVYKVAGLFAFIVLLYNLLLILFALAMLGATLTLPGIAGMILTIGMAIDASILIYERIKEELAEGSSMRKAVNVGFAGATGVILDANITHFLVAVVLYKLGAGPIQGFAVTMIVGIVSTLITGLLLLKSIFNFVIDTLGIHTIKI